MTILISGFSAFPGAPENPTQALAASLAGARAASGEAIETLVLPVEWDGAWPRLKAAIEMHRPAAVVLFGLHARAERLRIELLARNLRELGQVDAAGAFPAGPSVTEGPETLEPCLPLAAAMGALRDAGADFELSRDAGRYLCNDTFYRLCRHAEELGVRTYGFVHTPLSDEAAAGWSKAGGLPELCRTISAAGLRRAALAICEAVATWSV